MAAQFNQLQESSVVEDIHKSWNEKKTFQQRVSCGTGVRLFIVSVIILLMAILIYAEMPYLIFLHSCDKTVDGFKGTDGGKNSLVKAGNAVFQDPVVPSQAAYDANIEPAAK